MIVAGYAREPEAETLRASMQPKQIDRYCQQKGYNLLYLEQEAAPGKTICRPGMWRETRSLVCHRCDPGVMPTSYDPEAWLQRALMPCGRPEHLGIDGIVVASIAAVSTDPRSGATYALTLAIARKHLFSVENTACMSCCNPAAAPFMGRS